MHDAFAEAKNGIRSLTGLPGFDEPTSTVNQEASTEDRDDDSAASSVPQHHLQGQGGESQTDADHVPLKDDLLGVVEALVGILEAEVQTITNGFNLLKTEVLDQADKLSLSQIVTKILGIIGIILVETVKNLTVGVLSMLSALIDLIADAIVFEIHIPIISWLFRELTGGDEISMVNIVAFVVAFPMTIIYKATILETPFPDDEWTYQLIAAPTMAEFKILLHQEPGVAGAVGKRVKGLAADIVFGVVKSIGMIIRIVFTWLAEADSLKERKFPVLCFRWLGRLMTSIPSLVNAYESDAGWAAHLNTTMVITKLCRDGMTCFIPKMDAKWGEKVSKPVKIATGWWATGENILCLVADVGEAVKEDPIHMDSAKNKVIFSVNLVGKVLNHCGGALGGPRSIASKEAKIRPIIAETVLRSPYILTSLAVPIMQHVWKDDEEETIEEKQGKRAIAGPNQDSTVPRV